LPGHADFAHENKIDGRAERQGDLGGNRHAARGKASSTGCWPLYFTSLAANCRPASDRF